MALLLFTDGVSSSQSYVISQCTFSLIKLDNNFHRWLASISKTYIFPFLFVGGRPERNSGKSNNPYEIFRLGTLMKTSTDPFININFGNFVLSEILDLYKSQN